VFISRDGVKLFYREEGAGRPGIVFVHGGAVDHSTWDEHMAHFAPTHRVVAMDLRGHGQSDTTGPLTSNTFRDDLAALIDQLGLAPAVVIGASRGGGIATRVAVDYPGRVKALVLIDYGAAGRSSPQAPWARTPDQTEALLSTFAADWQQVGARRLVDSWFPEPGVPESLKERLTALCRHTPGETVLEIRRSDVAENDREDYLRKIDVPTLVMHGTGGRHLGRHQGEYIHERIKGSRLHYFEGRGHGCFMSAPEEFWHEVEEFLCALD
jgi:pimeloyl-ACP methyl ester carboxylesterase